MMLEPKEGHPYYEGATGESVQSLLRSESFMLLALGNLQLSPASGFHRAF